MFGLKNRRIPFKWVFAIWLVAVMSIIGVTIFTGDDEIQASRCFWLSPDIEFSNAATVFAGEVVASRRVESGWRGFDFDHHYEIEFLVDVVWKGQRYETLFVYTLPDDSWLNGGVDDWFKEGLEYVVYSGDTNPVRAWACDRIPLISDAEEDLEFLGKGMKPDPGSVSPTWTPPLESTPEPTPTSTPVSTPTPIESTLTPTTTPAAPSTPSPQNKSEIASSGCNRLARSSYTDFGALPLGLVAGIAWFGFRRRRRR